MKNKISAVFSYMGGAAFISLPVLAIFAVWVYDTRHIEFVKKLAVSLMIFCILCGIVVGIIHYPETKKKIDETE